MTEEQIWDAENAEDARTLADECRRLRAALGLAHEERSEILAEVEGEWLSEVRRLRALLSQIEARAQVMLDGGHVGPWPADYLREIAAEIVEAAREARR